MTRWITTALLELLRYRHWRRLLYPVMLLLAGVCAVGRDPAERPAFPASASHEERCVTRTAPVQAMALGSAEDRDPRTLWEHAVTHPILALLFLLGLVHALEISQKVTLPLLRHLRRQVERIIDGGAKHNHELDEIVRSILRRPRK
jgi:hypothetical protein